jgi:hypothetical protein
MCCQWNDWVRLALRYRKQCSPQQYMIVKYEDILREPEDQLRQICDFIGESFETGQLIPNVKTGTVPERENDWKGKAAAGPDPSRSQAWRNEAPREQVWEMNCRMATVLKRAGYNDVSLKGCPLRKRIVLHFAKLPYYRLLRPFFLLGLKVIRLFTGRKRAKSSGNTHTVKA